MTHPDPFYDADNSNEDDMNDFWGLPENELDELRDQMSEDEGYDEDEEDEDAWDDDYSDSFHDSMYGDAESAFESCGWGSDESYGYYGDDTPLGEEYYGGE